MQFSLQIKFTLITTKAAIYYKICIFRSFNFSLSVIHDDTLLEFLRISAASLKVVAEF